MPQIQITEKDRKWVSSNYPDLVIQESIPIRLAGSLRFRALRGSELPEIHDEYQIEIELSDSEISSLPQVKEAKGRLKRVAEEKGITELADLHSGSQSGTLCLCSPLEEDELFSNGFSLDEFFSGTLIPFFYAQSYFEKNDEWPWEHYGHGCPGLLESYAAIEETDYALAEKCLRLLKREQKIWDVCKLYLTRKGYVKGHWQCICGSTQILRKCHHGVLDGLIKLKQDVSDCSIEI